MAVGDIPFVKPVRVGNFKLWRSKFQVYAYPDLDEEQAKRMVAEKGKVRREKFDVECLNVSNLEGTWKVQVPSTFEMFAMLSALYSDYVGEDQQLRDRAGSVLSCFLGNMMYVSSIGNGYYQRALEMVAGCYACPDLLVDKKKSKELRKEVGKLIKDFLVWRKLWDESRQAFDDENDLKRDEIAEQAQELLKEEDDAVQDEDR